MIKKPDIENITPENFLDYVILYGTKELKKEVNDRYWELFKEIANPKYETMEDLDIMEEKLKRLVRYAHINIWLAEFENNGSLKLKEGQMPV